MRFGHARQLEHLSRLYFPILSPEKASGHGRYAREQYLAHQISIKSEIGQDAPRDVRIELEKQSVYKYFNFEEPYPMH